MNNKKGFTLIEILVVIGIIAVLAAVVLVAVNPARQFAQARNTQRVSNITALLNAVSQNMADNKGVFTCSAVGQIPFEATTISSESYNIRNCLVPNYLSEIPTDPTSGSVTSDTVYNTGYKINQDVNTRRIVVTAPSAELGQTISITR